MSSIVLFDDKKDCCGCGACMNVCPKMKSVLFIRKSIKICVLDVVSAKRLAVIKCNL